jgi:hypothetical protein
MSTKPTKLLEKEIEKKVCDYAKKKGFYVRKFTSPCARAVPDRLMIAPGGYVLFVEFKREGQVPTLAQLHEHKHITRVGGNVKVISSVESGCRLIDNVKWAADWDEQGAEEI